MRQITIVGAGQAGLLLGVGLLRQGYAVRLISDRAPEALRGGSILSTQCVFGTALAHERGQGLALWDGVCPPLSGVEVRIAAPGGALALAFAAELDRPAQSVDQRLKIPAWMERFAALGGELLVERADVAALERYARDSDLVVAATGKGEIGALFARDVERSPYDRPQRVLAASCVYGYAPGGPPAGVVGNLIPGAGEYFVMPGLTLGGPCHFMVLEALPGGPLDRWSDVTSPAEHLARLRALLAEWLPWEHERARGMELADGGAVLRGAFAPVVRRPIATLPSGAQVLGLADTLVLNDPVTGQGANNAAKAAARYLERVLAHGDRPFDAAWMRATFEAVWSEVRSSTVWTNAMLQPPPPHVQALLGAAAGAPALARWFVNAFDAPDTLFPYLADPLAAERLIAEARVAVA